MCGIAGIIDLLHRPVNPADLIRMGSCLRHRGPDAGGVVLLGDNSDQARFFPDNGPTPPPSGAWAGFAHRRLSIIDTSAQGIQPMTFGDGAYWIVQNGEVYNYRELRTELESVGQVFHTATDTEVLLAAYDQWGENCLDRFNGMWGFVIWDSRRQHFLLARDRFGVKPLYYTFRDGRLAFASEPKALLTLDWVSRDPDDRAIADYLVHGRVDCYDWTFFSSIKRLEPGSLIELPFDATTLPAPRVWWRLGDHLETPPARHEERIERFRDLFTSAVTLRLRSDVPVGTCLSGGLDSSAVVCTARPWLEAGNQKTFSAVYGAAVPEDESGFIDDIVRHAQVENYRVTPTGETLLADLDALIRCQDEPFGSTSQYAQYTVFKLARENGVTVTLDGQGADEALAGYHYLYPVHVAGLAREGHLVSAAREFAAWRSVTGAPLPDALASTLAGFMSHRAMIRWAARWDKGRRVDWVAPRFRNLARTLDAPEPPAELDPLNQRLYELFTFSSLPALLRYEDRNSMASSIEARLPFLDYRLVSYLFSLPATDKVQGGWTKYLMREALAGVIPENVRMRRDKIGFATPEASWYRTSVRAFLTRIIDEEKTRRRGIYDIPRLRTLVEANARGQVSAGRAIWRAVNLELWLRMMVDETPRS